MNTMTRTINLFPDDEYPPELIEAFVEIKESRIEYPGELLSATRGRFIQQARALTETPAETIERLAGKLGVQAEILTAPCGKLSSNLPAANAHEIAIAAARVNLANCKPSHRWFYVKRLREEREKTRAAGIEIE